MTRHSIYAVFGSDEWRLRAGDWRVRLKLDFEARTVIVVRILPRGRAYDR